MKYHESFLDLATLPENDGNVETVANFGLRLLASRSLNNLSGNNGYVLKQTSGEHLSILVLGEPEGKVRAITAINEIAGIEVSVIRDSIKLLGEGLDCGYNGCSGREWTQAHPNRQPEILIHTTRLLGELGLYSGVPI